MNIRRSNILAWQAICHHGLPQGHPEWPEKVFQAQRSQASQCAAIQRTNDQEYIAVRAHSSSNQALYSLDARSDWSLHWPQVHGGYSKHDWARLLPGSHAEDPENSGGIAHEGRAGDDWGEARNYAITAILRIEHSEAKSLFQLCKSLLVLEEKSQEAQSSTIRAKQPKQSARHHIRYSSKIEQEAHLGVRATHQIMSYIASYAFCLLLDNRYIFCSA